MTGKPETDGDIWRRQMREMLQKGFPWRATPDAGRWYLYDSRGACLARFHLDSGHASRLAAASPDLLNGCNALLGLIQLVCGRDDMPPAIREALLSSHRIDEANDAVINATRDEYP